MESEFLNRFYNTRHVVSIIELTNTRQCNNDLVIDYINLWRALSLKCKDHLPESSAIEMCAQWMDLDMLYVLQVIKPKTFQELATGAHDMELTITYYGKRLNNDESMELSRNESSVLRDSKEKEYSYSESNILEMPDKLLEKGLIELSE